MIEKETPKKKLSKKYLSPKDKDELCGPLNLKHTLYNAFIPRKIDWKPVKSETKTNNL